MGLTQKLGTIPLAIQTDSSNNIGIGGSPSGSYKFEVTGTARVSGLLTGANATFGSTGTGNNIIALSNNDQSNTRLRITNTGSGGQTFSIVGGNPGASNAGLAIFDETNSATRLYISSAGNVGIGTSSPDNLLDVYGTGTNTTRIRVRGTTNFALFQAQNDSSSALYMGIDSSTASGFNVGNYSRIIWSGGAYPLVIATNDTERMRITSAGNLDFNFVNTAAAYIQINQAPSQDGGLVFKRNLANKIQQALSNGDAMLFYSYGINNNAFVINQNGNATLYGTLTQNASDKRLKNNIQNIPNALDKINAINGVTFEWDNTIYKTDRTNDVGIIAQEVQAVLPEAVTLAPFDTADDGTSKSGENYLTAYYEKLIPLLIEGIKELNQKVTDQQQQINQLSAKVTALENK